MTVHHAPWLAPDGRIVVACVTPWAYGRALDFSARLKAGLPSRMRRWCPELRVWLVAEAAAAVALRAAREVYGAEALCPDCDDGAPCELWEALDAEAEALGGLGRLAGCAPLPPRQAEARVPPWALARRQAAELLGVREDAPAAVISAAARALARTLHPDAGGSDARMRAVLEARDLLLGAR